MEWMDILAQQIFNGVILGSVYALVALGYTMVYGILGLINFAHGDITMIGAMVAIAVLNALFTTTFGLHPLMFSGIALVAAICVCMLLGVGIERLAYRPLRKSPKLAVLITAIGVSMVLQNAAVLIWGRGYQRFPSLFSDNYFSFAGASLTGTKVAVVLVTAVVLLALWLLIKHSRLGRSMRATTQDPQMAQLMGVNINRLISTTFVIGSGLGALAGVMVAAIYGQADPYMGFILGWKAFSAAVLGGIGNLTGAVIGGLLLGLIESLGSAYLGTLTHGVLGSNYQDIFAFLVLILVLVCKPSGLLGKNTVARP